MKKLIPLISTAVLFAVSPIMAQDAPLRVVTEGAFPPWNYTQPSGEVIGFDIDVVKAICAELGRECEIDSLALDAIFPALNDGKYDFAIDALGITAARQEVIDFTVPYAGLCYSFASVTPAVIEAIPFEDRIEFLTEENLEDVMDTFRSAFEGATIATLSSGTSTRFVNAHLSEFASRPYPNPAARDLDLLAGRVDIVLASKDSLLALKETKNITGMELIGPCLRGDMFGSGGVGIAVAKGNADLKSELDTVIAELIENGTITSISEEHFGIDMSPVGL